MPTRSQIFMIIFIAWRNLWRNPVRSLLSMLALGGGLCLMIVYAALVDGMVKQMSDFATQISISDIQVHHQAYIDDQDIYAVLPWETLDQLPQNTFKFSPRLYAAGLMSSGDDSSGALIKAIDPQREREVTTLLNHVREGEGELSKVHSLDENLGDVHRVLIGSQLARNMSIKPGDSIVLITQAIDGSIGNDIFQVAGVFKPIEPNFDRMGVLMSIEAYQSLMGLTHGFHELAVSIEDNKQLIAIKEDIQNAINVMSSTIAFDKQSGAINVRTWREIIPAISDMLDASAAATYVLGMVIVGLASLGMLNTMLMAVHERTFEFGILLSIGMSRFTLLMMIMIESFYLSVLSAIFGSLSGWAGAMYLQVYGIDMSGVLPDGFDFAGIIFDPIWRAYFTPESIITSIILMMSIAMIASIFPSWQTTRLKPVEVLHE
ncbi:MAG: ABC transporter permease [Gammaproteobacteria bacterium]|nr:ABC transporter permease [Gammaproteobacteria bacterium]MDH5728967.1 ABC transporter permease [Gammaproteobacteria bacterium]